MSLGKALAQAALGGATGAAFGGFAMPHMSGYEDVPQARALAATEYGAMGAVLPILARAHGSAGIGAYLKDMMASNPKAIAGATGSALLGEVLPTWVATNKRQQHSMQAQTAAMQQTSIPDAVSRLTHSGLGRGAVAGAGTAGLLAVLTGIMRQRNRNETMEETPRTGMITKDFLRYVIPATIAGGIVGANVAPKPTA